MSVDSHFVDALVNSPSFYATVVWWGALACVLALLLALLTRRIWGRRRQSLRNRRVALAKDQSGAATAVDFALTIPLFLIVLLLIMQFVSMAHDALIVHYAAYAAARSARVWVWEPTGPASNIPGLSQPATDPFAQPNRSTAVQQQVERAARFALIPASPADSRLDNRGVGVPSAALQAMAAAAGQAGRGKVLNAKAAYAFDPGNSTISYRFADGFGGGGGGRNGPRPVSAKVEFRVHLGIPVAKVLGTRGRGGRYYQTVSAEMTVL